jgi:hypothetical protein
MRGSDGRVLTGCHKTDKGCRAGTDDGQGGHKDGNRHGQVFEQLEALNT